jgi:CheY-like chemotaxis protein
MSRLPLVKLPKRIVYVDDDGAFLDALRRIMPKHAREFRDSPRLTLEAIHGEMPYWRAIELLLANAHESRDTPGGEARMYVKRYFQDWRRFHMTGVLIVDYNMPGMTGIDLVRELDDCPARRVLLTGVADAEVAVRAFNQGLIQKFIPKSTPNLNREITNSANEMHRSVCEHLGHLMRGTLTGEQVELLHERSVVDGLERKLEELGWIEYVVVGEPFGILGLAYDGPLQWIQLETEQSLSDHAESLADYGYEPADVKAVRDCTAVSTHEILTKLGLPATKTVIDTDSLSTQPTIFCAVVDLPIPVMTAKSFGIDDVQSIDEVMRSLLRDVTVAYRSGEVDAPDPDAAMALQQALSNLGATAAATEFHKQALHAAMAQLNIDSAIAAQIEIAVVRERRKGGPNGR